MEDLSHRIAKMIDDEVERRVRSQLDAVTIEYNEKLDGYINHIALHHGISKDLLLRDVPALTDRTRCKGMKKDNSRCTRKGTHHGYCTMHLYQMEQLKPVVIDIHTSHTHGMDVLHDPTCPACVEQDRKRVIDLNSILFNHE